MTERVFSFNDKTPVVNPDEYLVLDSEANRVVCLSLRDIHVINSYLWPFTQWRTRFSRPYRPNAREESSAEEFEEYLLDLSDLSARIGEASVTTCTDAFMAVVAAIDGMAAVLAAKNFTVTSLVPGGTCGDNCAPGSGPLVDPGEADGQSGPSEVPPGWEGDLASYRDYKCKAANFLADSYIKYVEGFTSLSGILSVISPTLFFLPVPDAFMALLSPALAFALFAYLLATFIGFTGLVALMGTYLGNLSSTRDQFVCDLYSAISVPDAKAVIQAWIEDNLPVGIPSSWVTYHMANLFPNSIVNILFVEYGAMGDYAPLTDCTECEPETCMPELSLLYGSGDLTLDGNPRELTAELDTGNGNYYLRVENATQDPCCEVYVEQVDYTGSQPTFDLNLYRCNEELIWGTDWYFGTTPLGSNIYGSIDYAGYISWASTSPFTVTIILDAPH